MGKKPYKIKRYKNIYGSSVHTGKSMKVIGIIASVIICCFAGWMLYEPVYNFLMKDDGNEESISSKEESKEESLSSDAMEQSSSENPESVPSSPVKEEKNDGGVFLPHAILNNPEQLDTFLKDLKEKGCTSVAVEAKNAIGEVLYLTENETAIDSRAVSGNAFDAKKVAEAIKSAGLVPVAKLHGYRDGIAAMANNDMAVKYYDTTYIWLDNSAELGGRGWLNPYEPESAEYIGSLASELVLAGFSDIIVDSVHYPLGVAREKMGFGEVTLDKLSALSASMKKIEDMVINKGGRISFVVNPADYINDLDRVYGGDILKDSRYSYTLTSSLDNMELVKSSLEKINSMGKEPDIILLSYTYDGSQATNDRITDAIDELRKNNVGSIYLYNPQGIY